MRMNLVVSGMLIHAVLSVPSMASEYSFTALGQFPEVASGSKARAVSADGAVVVGYAPMKTTPSTSPVNRAFRWTREEGLFDLGALPTAPSGLEMSLAYGVSVDGSVVVGTALYGVSPVGTVAFRAFRWTAEGGLQDLGQLDGYVSSGARAASADGSVIVGRGYGVFAFSPKEAFRWTAQSGLVGLGDLAGDLTYSSSGATAVSADGEVVVGAANQTDVESQAFRWNMAAGMTGLGDLPGGAFRSSAEGISRDGLVIVGIGESADGRVAFRWTAQDGMQGLGDLPGGAYYSAAAAVSADGAIIVGRGTTADGLRAFIWDAQNGLRPLEEVLAAGGVTAIQDWSLVAANGISDDGRTIVGEGLNPEGNVEAWVATLPRFDESPACPGSRRPRRRRRSGTDRPCGAARTLRGDGCPAAGWRSRR